MKKKAFILVFIAAFVILAAQVAGTGYPNLTQVFHPGPFTVGTYDVGFYNSTFIYGKNFTGYGTVANEGYEFLSDNATYVMSSAFASGAVTINLAIGNYTIDHTLTLGSGDVLNGIGGSLSMANTLSSIVDKVAWIKLADGSNTDMIHLGNSTEGETSGAILRNLVLDGNKAAQTAGNGTVIVGNSQTLENVHITNVKENGLDLRYVAEIENHESRISKVTISNTDGNGIISYPWGNNDNHFDSVTVEYSPLFSPVGSFGIYSASSGNIYTNTHVWGYETGVALFNLANDNRFDGTIADTNLTGLYLGDEALRNTISVTFYNTNAGTATGGQAIDCSGDYNIFIVSINNTGVTGAPDYGILFEATSQYNTLVTSGSIEGTFDRLSILNLGVNNNLPIQSKTTVTVSIFSDSGTTYYQSQYPNGTIISVSTNASDLISQTSYTLSINNGGRVLLENGVYAITGDIIVYNNTILEGETKEGVLLGNNRAFTTGNGAGLIRNQHCTNASYGQPEASWVKDANLTVRRLTVYGNRTGSHAGFGMSWVHADNVVVEDVDFWNVDADTLNFDGLSRQQGGLGKGNGTSFGVVLNRINIYDAGIDGLAMNNVQNFFVTDYNCSRWSQKGSGTNNGWAITLAGTTGYGTIDNFHVQESSEIATGGQGSGGVHAIDTIWTTFSNGWIYNANGTGFYMESDAANPRWNTIINLHVINSTSENIYVKNGYDLSWTNIITLNAGYGGAVGNNFNNFYFVNTERSRMINIELYDNQASPTTYCGVYETSNSANNIWMGISIFGASNSTAIYLLGTGTKNSTIIVDTTP